MDQTSEAEKIYQQEKFNEIIELLLSVGYFKARIKSTSQLDPTSQKNLTTLNATISDFDKVVGGLCWCITSSGEDVDVDILFQENSSIGQRIALSEVIVKALRRMNCPVPLQPHQIQGGVAGSDFPAIYPVIFWLVKKYLERKGHMELQARRFSLLYFSKQFNLVDTKNDLRQSMHILRASERDKVTRKFRRLHCNDEDDELIRVRSCLLEYGENFHSSNILGSENEFSSFTSISSNFNNENKNPFTTLSGFERALQQAQREALKEEIQLSEQAGNQDALLMQNMDDAIDWHKLNLTESQIQTFLDMNEIEHAAEVYRSEIIKNQEQLQSNLLQDTGALGHAARIAAFEKQQQSLLQQQVALEDRVILMKNENTLLLQKIRLLEGEQVEAKSYHRELQTQLKRLTELEIACTRKTELKSLQHLIELTDRLKKEEVTFKNTCREQMKELTDRIHYLENLLQGSQNNKISDEEKQFNEISKVHNKLSLKYNHLRSQVADITKEVSTTSRQIDDIPTRIELLQYERRFEELYRQVSGRLEDTRKYYSLYNTLDASLSFLQKELKLQNTLGDSFDIGMSTSQNRVEYLSQFKSMVAGVEESLTRQEQLHDKKLAQVDELRKRYRQLIEEQRMYIMSVKTLQEECVKNEWLVAKLEEITSK